MSYSYHATIARRNSSILVARSAVGGYRNGLGYSYRFRKYRFRRFAVEFGNSSVEC